MIIVSYDLLLYIFITILIALAIVVVELRDLLYSVIVLGVEGVVLAALFYLLQAPDIAITQIAVGSGALTFLFILALRRTERWED
ncbi:MAG: DUF4040 domain-containing protein [Nitrososphaerota archaeon]|nr:DUF4040 domain-containing protein [Nitrososphaerales archaeon]MDW8044490.1 DUF4040 domain-containing protein [Nitrososphaerota archaeon]